MWLLLRLDWAELSSQVDEDLCSALGKLSSRKQEAQGNKDNNMPKKKKNPT